MNYFKTHLNLVIAIVFLLLATIFFISFYQLKFNKHPQIKIEKTIVDSAELPELFPKDIPIEKDAKITQNYNATSPDGRFQATRAFETKKTLDENLKIYQDYFKKNKWEVQSTLDTDANYKMIFAVKLPYQVQISMNKNTTTGVKTVDISLTKLSSK